MGHGQAACVALSQVHDETGLVDVDRGGKTRLVSDFAARQAKDRVDGLDEYPHLVQGGDVTDLLDAS